jgi:tellurite resistance protein TerC
LTSNLFAILGLRAMYFLIAEVAERFEYLKYGLAVVLVFVGAKMLIVDLVKIPILLSLGIVALIIAVSVGVSLRKTASTRPRPNGSGEAGGAGSVPG